MQEKPYIEKKRIVVDRKHNPKYDQNKLCECGHAYHRHFDSYDDMRAIGCKYCDCFTFKRKMNVINYIVKVREQGGYKTYNCEIKEDVIEAMGQGWQYIVTSPTGKDVDEFIPF